MKLVHCAANADPAPEHDANSPNARSPTVSTSVTRSPLVATCFQVCPPSWVANSSGPNAHPSFPLRNRIWLTPVAPSGGPVSGAGTPIQVFPALSVRATEVQNWVAHGGPACPITQPARVLTKVTEVGRKLAGTPGGGAEAARAGRVGRGGAAAAGRAVGVAERPAATPDEAGEGLSVCRLTTCGTVTAAATITAAAPAVTASLRYLAPPGPALDQLERARWRRQRVDPPVQPGIEVVAVRHRDPQAPP